MLLWSVIFSVVGASRLVNMNHLLAVTLVHERDHMSPYTLCTVCTEIHVVRLSVLYYSRYARDIERYSRQWSSMHLLGD